MAAEPPEIIKQELQRFLAAVQKSGNNPRNIVQKVLNNSKDLRVDPNRSLFYLRQFYPQFNQGPFKQTGGKTRLQSLVQRIPIFGERLQPNPDRQLLIYIARYANSDPILINLKSSAPQIAAEFKTPEQIQKEQEKAKQEEGKKTLTGGPAQPTQPPQQPQPTLPQEAVPPPAPEEPAKTAPPAPTIPPESILNKTFQPTQTNFPVTLPPGPETTAPPSIPVAYKPEDKESAKVFAAKHGQAPKTLPPQSIFLKRPSPQKSIEISLPIPEQLISIPDQPEPLIPEALMPAEQFPQEMGQTPSQPSLQPTGGATSASPSISPNISLSRTPRLPPDRLAPSAGQSLIRTTSKSFFSRNLIPIIVVIVFIFLVLLYPSLDQLIRSIPLLPLIPACTNQGGGNIAACKFYRGDQKPPEAPFTSNTLIGYFTEVSSATGIPASILAGITRIETPDSVNYTDQKISSIEVNPLSDCPTSSTGALGLMQVQPAGTKGYSEQGAKIGARYLGRDPNSLTPTDYCTPRTNIYLGAGVILAKMGGDTWDPAWNNEASIDTLADRYYGCPKYPSCQNGPYSYGDDLWKSYSNCSSIQLVAQSTNSCYCTSTSSAVASCPVPGGTIKTPSYQADNAKGHCTPGYGLEGNCRTDCPGGISQSRRAKAIDVPTNGQNVVLPTVGGTPTTWSLIVKDYPVDTADGGGFGETFEAKVGNDTWTLDMLHMEKTSLETSKTYFSGTPVGKTAIDHVHMTMGKNLTANPVVPGQQSTDCDPGWQPSDFMCGGPNLTSGSTTNGGSCTQNGVNKFVYYCQGDPQWASYPYPDSCKTEHGTQETLSSAGCGPTAMAMVLSTFGIPLTPPDVGKVFSDPSNGWYACGKDGGSDMSAALQSSWLSDYGLSTGVSIASDTDGNFHPDAIDLTLAKQAIDANKLIIASSDNFPTCNCGHIVVIDSVDVAAGTVHVQDPICGTMSNPSVNPSVYSAKGGPGWTWIYAYPVGRI